LTGPCCSLGITTGQLGRLKHMAKSSSSNSNSTSLNPPRYPPRWVIGSVCLLIGIMLSVAFVDFSPEQSLVVTTNPTAKNLVGRFGAEASFWSLRLVGISTWLIPAFLLWMAYVSVRNARRLANTRIIAMILCIISLSGLAAMIGSMTDTFKGTQYFPGGLGGDLGGVIYNNLLKDTLGVFGAGLLLGMIYCIGLMFIISKDIGAEFEKIGNGFSVPAVPSRATNEPRSSGKPKKQKAGKNTQPHRSPSAHRPPTNFPLPHATRTRPSATAAPHRSSRQKPIRLMPTLLPLRRQKPRVPQRLHPSAKARSVPSATTPHSPMPQPVHSP